MALQDDVNILTAEVQAREPFITSTSTGFDGNPNISVLPVFANAPLGTWYHRSGTDQFYRKNLAGIWELQGTAGNFVQEPITIVMGEQVVGARELGDPSFPVGTKFTTQEEVDAALDGAPAFRFANDITDAFAGLFSEHDITLDYTAITTNQRGRDGDTAVAYDFSRTSFFGKASWVINYPDPADWPVVGGFSGLTITAHQDGSQDPFVDFLVGEGVPNDETLKGRYIRLSTGQLCASSEARVLRNS